MNGRRRLFLAALAGTGAAAAQDAGPVPTEVAADLAGARLQGSGRLRFLGLSVYEARLWSGAKPVAADWSSTPFALSLTYARALAGPRISERSLVEMRRQGPLAEPLAQRWLAQLQALLPDVDAGDRITGVNQPQAAARFYFNGALRGEVRDADFARVFFGIWLAPETSEPGLRKALLGGPA